jgi:hypothetical protein
MGDRRLEGLVRLIDKRKAGDKGTADSMIDWAASSAMTGAAGEGPTCTLDGDDSADVLEPYGFACSAPAGEALVFAPGGDVDNLVALVSSVPGRPATDANDVVVWTVGGHTITLDDDGDLVVAGKDGGTVTIAATTGAITVEAATGASVNINVGVGASVNIGGPGAAALALGQKVIDVITATLAGGVPVLGDGGANLKATMITAFNLVKTTILATKAKGI